MKEVTSSVMIPLYEVALEDGTIVRFHEYEMEDGGLRIWHKRLSKFGFPEQSTAKGMLSKPDASLVTYEGAMIPFAELKGQCVSPIQVGTIRYKRDYKRESERKGLIFKRTEYTFSAISDTYVEYDEETILTGESA